MVAYTIKYMEMPKNCWNCKCSNFCSHFREHGCLFNGDRPSSCPLVEIGACKDCKWWDKDEEHCLHLSDSNGWFEDEYYQVCTDKDFYCKDFEKRGSENEKKS